jgi:hypothetical protein
MTWPDDERDARLSELLSDSVSDVEPDNALDSIRNRTKVTPMSARRPWLFAVGGAVVATAAVVTAVAVAGGNLTGEARDPDPAGQTTQPTKQSEPDPSESESPTDESDAPIPVEAAVPVYFAGETPRGLRLYREFQPGIGADPLLASASASVAGDSLDPDYLSLWPEGSGVASVTADGADILTVDVTGAPHDLPSGMSQEDAQLALQQVIYSVQAAHGQGRVGVQFLLDGGRTDQVLGQPTSEPLANAPILETLSHVSLTTPSEGDVVAAGPLQVEGVANSFEANVVVRVQRWEGTAVVAEQPFTAEGWMEEKLFPFSGTIDLSDVPPGDYVLIAMTDDPSGGAEGFGAFTDTRRITVK